jgi:hypothetical protein
MDYPKEWIDEIDNIKVLSLSGDLILYYDKHPDELKAKLKDEETRWAGYDGNLPNKEITCASICIFDSNTERYSDTSVYKNKKGYWFKKAGKKYYFNIDFLDKLE